MRKLPVGIAISVVFHVAVVIWVATRPDPSVIAAPHSQPTTVEILPPSTPEPMAVAVLDELATRRAERQIERDAGAATAPTAPAHRPPRGTAAISTGRTSGVETPNREATGAGSGSSLMKMRGRGTNLATGPSAKFVDDFLDRSKPLQNEVPESGELHRSANGHYRSEQGTFDLDVERDGTAHIAGGTGGSHSIVAVPSVKAIGNGISQWAEDPRGYGEHAAQTQMRGEYHALGDDDKPQSSNVVGIPVIDVGGLIGRVGDVNDWLMRSHGQDPYASKKLAVLDATRDERVQIGAKHRHEQLTHASQLVTRNLARVGALDPLARKQALFELWDECAETGANDLVEAGRVARSLVIGFIRANLREANAYTADELGQLNAHRQSTAPFSPYE